VNSKWKKCFCPSKLNKNVAKKNWIFEGQKLETPKPKFHMNDVSPNLANPFSFGHNFPSSHLYMLRTSNLLATPTKGRILCLNFRFIIEYSSLRDFGP